MRFKLDNYRIGELANIYGVTVETIRFYENSGIVEAERGENNYRTYKKEEVISMEYVMRLRNLDMSIERIKSIIDAGDLKSIMEATDEKQKELKRQIEMIDNQIKILESYKSKIKNCIEEENHITIIKSPGFFLKDFTSGVKNIIEEFHEISPLLSPMITVVMKPEDICLDGNVRSRKERYDVCEYYMAAENVVHNINSHEFEKHHFEYIPPMQCIHSVIKVHTNKEYEKFMELFDQMAFESHKINGDIIIQLVAMESTSNDGIEYYEIWLPVEKIK